MKRPLNVICSRVHWDNILESYFFREVLLGGLKRPVRVIPLELGQAPPTFDDLLVIGLLGKFEWLIELAIQKGARNIGVFHVGDERFDLDRSIYPSVDYVIRNYFRADVLSLPSPCRCM